MISVGKTHVGRVRENNEDYFCVDQDLGLFLVADGMGGHASGEVASRMAVEILRELYARGRQEEAMAGARARGPLDVGVERLVQSIQLANRAIYELSLREERYRGMGTTLAGIVRQGDHLLNFHVGDSRIYRLQGRRLEQLSEDHSVVSQQVKMGIITEEEARTSRIRNVITRAVGVQWDVEVDLSIQEWEEGDLYMLCTDGLSDFVPQDTMERVLLARGEDLEGAATELVQEALDKGGHDNITVVLVRFKKHFPGPFGGPQDGGEGELEGV